MQKNGKVFINLIFFCNFYVSLLPLWFSIFLKYLLKIYFLKKYYICFSDKILKEILTNFHFIFIFIVFVLFVFSLLKLLEYIRDYNAKMEDKKSFSKVKKHRTLTINFILTYVLPIMAFDFWEVEGIILFVVYFTVLLFLIVKNRIFDGNIMLEILGYYFYDCVDKKNQNEYIVISKFIIKKEKPYKLKFVNQNDVAFVYN